MSNIINNIALIESFGDFKDEKGISKIDLMAIIEDSLKTLLRKRYDSDDHFDVIVNPDKGDFQIFLNKRIVEDEMSEDDDLEIEISEAKKIDATFEVGEEFTQEIPVAQLGRRNILTLKQILATKLQEHNNAMLYDQFRDKREIAVGEVTHNKNPVVISIDKEDGDDVELVEFADEIEEWIINEFKKVGLDTARSVLDKETSRLAVEYLQSKGIEVESNPNALLESEAFSALEAEFRKDGEQKKASHEVVISKVPDEKLEIEEVKPEVIRAKAGTANRCENFRKDRSGGRRCTERGEKPGIRES
ncbi:hypothetical protein FQR65_LT16218 [Abscondita terminalis]|nr:hypothetical protein FQR65_LT16218 [Abscondita terminalis]